MTSLGKLSGSRRCCQLELQVGEGAVLGQGHQAEPPHGLGEARGADHPRLVAVGVELHLPREEPADQVADLHQHPEHAAGQPDRQPGRGDQDDDEAVVGRGPRLEGLVPLVALVDDPGEPQVDPHDQRIEPHPRPLREVAELVGEHAGELLERDAGRERQADGEDQLAAQDAEEAPVAVRRGVDPAVDLDPGRPRRADRVADAVHEGVQERLLARLERPRLRPARRSGEQRLDHQRDDHRRRRPGARCRSRPRSSARRPWRAGGSPRGGSRGTPPRRRPGR